MKKRITASILACLVPTAVLAGSDPEAPIAIGEKVPGFELPDQLGQTHALETYLSEGNVVVLEWFNPECPAVGFYHLRSNAAVMTWSGYEDKNVVWLAVNSFPPRSSDRAPGTGASWSITVTSGRSAPTRQAQYHVTPRLG